MHPVGRPFGFDDFDFTPHQFVIDVTHWAMIIEQDLIHCVHVRGCGYSPLWLAPGRTTFVSACRGPLTGLECLQGSVALARPDV